MKDFGIVRARGGWALAYGWGFGFGHKWLPHKIMRLFVKAWNPIACRLKGHFWIPDFGEQTGQERYAGGLILYGIEHAVCSHCRARRLTTYDPERIKKETTPAMHIPRYSLFFGLIIAIALAMPSRVANAQ